MADNLRAEVLQGLGDLLDRSEIPGLCANCGMILYSDLHRCDAEKAADEMIAANWKGLLGGSSPTKRAKSYRVG